MVKRNQILIIASIILGGLVFLVFCWTVYSRYILGNKEASSLFENPLKSSLKESSPLNGILVEREIARRKPIAVVIENQPASRPQSGLSATDIVYEVLTEGGITRFLAIYQSQFPEKVGPIRSARTYFIDWLAEYNGFFVHYGGNYDALQKIKKDKIEDLDEFANAGSKAYWRENKPGVAVEHTAYGSIPKLYELGVSKKYSPYLTTSFMRWKFKKEDRENKNNETETSVKKEKIVIDFSSEQFKVVWNYNSSTNSYLREMGGEKHLDKNTNEQISAKNILIQEVESWAMTTEINETGLAMKTIGQGKAKIIRDGDLIEGTWRKTDRQSRTLFFDKEGKEIKFNPGRIWLEIVPPGTKIEIK